MNVILIIAFTVPFIFVIIIERNKSNERQKRYDLQAKLYEKALEAGQPIPTDFFPETKKKRNSLNPGIILTSIGIGIMVLFWLISIFLIQVDSNAVVAFKSFAALGIIPLSIGIAFLIIHFIDKGKNTDKNAQ